MSEVGDGGLGGRLPLLTPDRLSARQRTLYDTFAPAKRAEAARGGYVAATEDGGLIGPFNSYLFIPDIADGYIAWIDAQHTHLSLPPEVREAVILTIGAVWNAPFELYAHRAVARTAGMPAETIEALARGEVPAGLSDAARAARAFTHALVTRHAVDDATYAAAQVAFGDEGLVGLTHLIGLYLSVSAVLTAFRVPAPDDAPAALAAAALAQYPADPRHVIGRPPSRESRFGVAGACRRRGGGAGWHRMTSGS